MAAESEREQVGSNRWDTTVPRPFERPRGGDMRENGKRIMSTGSWGHGRRSVGGVDWGRRES